MNKIWTFVIGKNISRAELDSLRTRGTEFVKNWTAHDHPLDASFEIVKDRLVRVTVNAQTYAASGCSIDKLTRFIKEAGTELGTDLLDRHLVAFEKDDGSVAVAGSGEIAELLGRGEINAETPVYDNTVADETAPWKKPLRDTWLNRFLPKS